MAITKVYTKTGDEGMTSLVGGEGTATVSKEKIEQGEEVTFTATAKKGATFTGWYDVLGTKVSDEAVYTVTPEENLTLIAKFEKGSEPDQPEDKTYTELCLCKILRSCKHSEFCCTTETILSF